MNPDDNQKKGKDNPSLEEVLAAFLQIPPPPKKAKAKKRSKRGKGPRKTKA